MSHISYVEVLFTLKNRSLTQIFYLHTKEKQISHVEAFIDIRSSRSLTQRFIFTFKKVQISYVEVFIYNKKIQISFVEVFIYIKKVQISYVDVEVFIYIKKKQISFVEVFIYIEKSRSLMQGLNNYIKKIIFLLQNRDRGQWLKRGINDKKCHCSKST